MKRFNKKQTDQPILIIFLATIGLGLLLYLVPAFGFKKIVNSVITPSPQESSLYDDFHLVIPSLAIEAPVIADVNGADENEYFKVLEGGVAHLKGSSKPGDGSNIFIFGHSSFYWYKPGDYKTILAKLEDIKKGDEIILWKDKKKYVYVVSETKVVDPEDVDVLKPSKTEQVSLMTCVPPGTDWQRLIVIAPKKI